MDNEEFLKFAYELRKIDVDNKYSYNLMNGQVKPNILVDIICSNKWNVEESRMMVDPKFKYRLISKDSLDVLNFLPNKNDLVRVINQEQLNRSAFNDSVQF
jgi:hypothetical protein